MLSGKEGKLDFDHHLLFRPSSWRDKISAHWENLFFHRPKRTFRFCKIGFRNYIFLVDKWLLVFVLFCCNTLSNFNLLSFKLKLSSSLERCLQGKNYSMYGFEIAQPLRCSDSAYNLQRCNCNCELTNFGRSVLDNNKNSKYKKCFISRCWPQTLLIILGGFTAL